MNADQFEYWKHTQLILGVTPGSRSSFSLEIPLGVRFHIESRIFTDEELEQLTPLRILRHIERCINAPRRHISTYPIACYKKTATIISDFLNGRLMPLYFKDNTSVVDKGTSEKLGCFSAPPVTYKFPLYSNAAAECLFEFNEVITDHVELEIL